MFTSLNQAKLGGKLDIVYFEKDDDDRIDLSGIDASESRAGDQAFSWIGRDDFSGKEGELRKDAGVIHGDVDGDGEADFAIAFDGDLNGSCFDL
ncbi:MAG: hypothetical protein R3D80_10920 [Paracoccaceae bacterium]